MDSHDFDSNYRDLANAIIKQACKDYRTAYRAYKKNPNSKEVQSRLFKLSRFFHSWWFSQLTDIDGRKLLERLRNEENERWRTKKHI